MQRKPFFRKIRKKLQIRKIRRTVLRICSVATLAVGVILVAALPAAASAGDNFVYPDYGIYSDFVLQNQNNSNYNLFINTLSPYPYHLYFICLSQPPNLPGVGVLWGVGSDEPIKFTEQFGFMGLAVPSTNSTCRAVNFTYENSRFSIFAFQGASAFTFHTYSDVPSYGFYTVNSSSSYYDYAGVSLQKFFYKTTDTFPNGSQGWQYVEGTGYYFYDSLTDENPIGSVTVVQGGGGRTYEDYYNYDYEVDGNGDYVPGSGNIQFDFGAGDKVKSFFNSGFFGEIRTWIQEGNDGSPIQPMTLFSFDVDYKNHHWHSDGFTLDFSDRNSFVSLLAFIVFPVYAFEILCNLWGLAFKILTGVPLWHINDSSITVPLPDDDSAYLL